VVCHVKTLPHRDWKIQVTPALVSVGQRHVEGIGLRKVLAGGDYTTRRLCKSADDFSVREPCYLETAMTVGATMFADAADTEADERLPRRHSRLIGRATQPAGGQPG
jgi:hypothetical protein